MPEPALDWTVRAATPYDAAEISRLAKLLTHKFIASDCTDDGLKRLLETLRPEIIRANLERGYRYHVAESHGDVVGAIGVRDNRHLYHLYVAEAFQGRGVARALWASARAACLAAGNPGQFTVNAASAARAVYERFGFVAQSEPVTKNGVTALPMQLNLDPARSA